MARRCGCGLPQVIETGPRLPGGTPFPTLWWLTCRDLSSAVGGLEASGFMRAINASLDQDTEMRRQLEAATEAYVSARDSIEVLGTTSHPGGGPGHVKCLHAHIAHELAGGPNPVGRAVLDILGWNDPTQPCVPRLRPERLAAIDVGTNTTRLLLAEADGAGYLAVSRQLKFTRLGEGVDRRGLLSGAAVNRTADAVRAFADKARGAGAGRIAVAATSAVRDAANREVFVQEVLQATGLQCRVLSGDEEASLSFRGATAGLEPARYLVCDIGGGSTEMVLGGSGSSIEAQVSLNLGSVRLTERCLAGDPPSEGELVALDAVIDDALDGAGGSLAGAGTATLVGLAGTVTSLSALSLGLASYDPAAVHGSRLSAGDVERLYLRLSSMPASARSQIPVLPEGRSDIIVAGAAILRRIMKRWSFPFVVVSERDILDGLVLEMRGR